MTADKGFAIFSGLGFTLVLDKPQVQRGSMTIPMFDQQTSLCYRNTTAQTAGNDTNSQREQKPLNSYFADIIVLPAA